eukprot:scaffold43789_cov50-Phaeocystis_antarctica.AAC.3
MLASSRVGKKPRSSSMQPGSGFRVLVPLTLTLTQGYLSSSPTGRGRAGGAGGTGRSRRSPG